MGGDILIAFVVHPVTHAFVTTTDRKLLELEYDAHLGTPVYKMCETVMHRMRLGFAIVYLRKAFQVCEAFGYDKALLLFEADRCSTEFTLPSSLTWTPMHEATSVSGLRTLPSLSNFLFEYSKHGLDVDDEYLYPYSRAGWFERSSEWMSSQLKAKQDEKVIAVKQFTLSTQGSVLCAMTQSKQEYYMKAVPPKGMNKEVVVSWAISQEMPEIFWKPIAVDFEKGWIIMSDYGVPLKYGDCFIDTQRGSHLMRKILLQWSVVQKQSISKERGLVAQGVPVWDEFYVQKAVQRMMRDPIWYDMQKKGMNDEELARFGKESEYKQSYAAYVKRLFGKLAEFKVPLSLVHGDLNPVNVILQDDGTFFFFDFALTCYSVPFIDAIRFISVCGGSRDDLGFYLAQWTEFESMDRLRELLHVVDDLDGVLSLLILYHGYVTSEKVLRSAACQELTFGVWNTFNKYL